MSWIWYILEANLYLLGFYSFYLLFLQHETFYASNRFYLLITSLISFLLPILQLGILKPSAEILSIVAFPEDQNIFIDSQVEVVEPVATFSPTTYLLMFYLVIASLFAIKLAWDIFKILKIRYRATEQQVGQITIVNLTEETAFSFFNLLFVHPKLAQKKAVMEHEMIHIRQKHSMDILLFEILQIVSWFNPVLYLIKKDLKLIHEYIADELSTPDVDRKHEYALFLIENSFGIMPTPLTNQFFNQSILKRRINMLNKKRTVGWARLKLLLALPLTAGMLCTSTMAFTKDYGYLDLLPEKSENNATTLLQQVVEKTQNPVKVENIQIKEVPIKAPKIEQVKFSPPVFKNATTYVTKMRYNKATKKYQPAEVRYIVINGNPVTDLSNFYGAKNAKKIVFVKPVEAQKKYGKSAQFGAIEITGPDVKILDYFLPPPLPIQRKKAAIAVEEIEITNVKKDEIVEVRLEPAKQTEKVMEIRLSPPKKEKQDSLRTINIKLAPKVKKADQLEEIRIEPITSENKKVRLMPKTADTSNYLLAKKKDQEAINAKVKKAIQLEIIQARKPLELEIVPRKKN